MIFACFLSALSLIFTANKKRAERELGGSRSAVKSFCCRVLFADSRCGRYGCFFFIAVLKTLKDGARVIRGFAQRIVNSVAHFQSCLESGFLAAVLAVGKIFGELIPLAADAQSPSLEGSGLVCIAGNVTLGHGCVCCLLTFGEVRPRTQQRMPDIYRCSNLIFKLLARSAAKVSLWKKPRAMGAERKSPALFGAGVVKMAETFTYSFVYPATVVELAAGRE